MQLIKLIIMVVLIIGCGMLLYQNQVLNPDPITIWLYPGFEKELLLPVILALTLLCGAMVGFFIGLGGDGSAYFGFVGTTDGLVVGVSFTTGRDGVSTSGNFLNHSK